MSRANYDISQSSNIGVVQAVNHGDNISYVNTKGDLTPKHVATELHKKAKAEWETSGTCRWLMGSKIFLAWERMEAKYAFLWLHGRFGCGKTILMSRIIERIYHEQCEKRSPKDIHLLYFYANLRDSPGKDKIYRQMLMTFWEQAVNGIGALNIFGENTPSKTIEEELHKVLVSSGRDLYMIIDGLDQFSPASQDQLLSGLNSLVQKLQDGKSDSHLRVAVSSRDYDGINQLRAHKLFPIEVTSERSSLDIATYLETSLRSSLFGSEPWLKQEVLKELKKNADGSFLWAHLQALNMCNMKIGLQVTHALENLTPPQKILDMYRVYAEEFELLEDPIHRDVARRTVALLAHNNGSLAKDVMLLALSLDAKGKIHQSIYQGMRREPDVIVRFCNYLVRLNENLDVFQFCHTSVSDFFRDYKSPFYNHRVAELCLSYLCSPEFSKGPRNDATWFNPSSLGNVLQKNPFLQFASLRWAISIKKSFSSEAELPVEESHSTVLTLLEYLFNKDRPANGSRNADWRGNLQLAFQIYFLSLGKPISKGISHEHIRRGWFDTEKTDKDGLRPIHWAIRNENDLQDANLVVQKLLNHRADTHIEDGMRRTPLYYASYYGNLEVAQLLVRRGAQIDHRANGGETALIAACRRHHEAIVVFLTESGADVKCQSTYGTALQLISLTGCYRCADSVLESYGRHRITELNGPFGTSLHAAAYHGHSNLIRLLCLKRMDFHATHRTFGSPITAAAAGCTPEMDEEPYLDIIQQLIMRGSDVNDKSGTMGPALRAAALHGHKRIVRLLLAKGAKVRKVNGQSGSAYQAAEERGHHEIMEILLASDPKAAKYGKSDTSQTQNHQQIQRKVFRATVKASSMETINNLIVYYEKLFERGINRGETSFLKGLAKLGENCFRDVIELATKTSNSPSASAQEQPDSPRSLLKDIASILRFKGSTYEDDELAPEVSPTTRSIFSLRKARPTFDQDSPGEHFEQILDRLTQAAVKILAYALAREDREVIRLISHAWVEALNELVLHPSLGESMLQTVVQKRANELKGFLIDGSLSVEERHRKSQALALVGVELLAMAVECGGMFQHLAFTISKLWIKALQDVESLGPEGEAPIREMIKNFKQRIVEAITTRDQSNAKVSLQAYIEILRASALSPKQSLLHTFVEESIGLWELVLQGDMAFLGTKIMSERNADLEEHFKDKEHDKILGLGLAFMGVLQEAIRQGGDATSSKLQETLVYGLSLARKSYHSRDLTDEDAVSDQTLRVFFDRVVALFATAEDIRPQQLNTLAGRILDLVETVLNTQYHEVTRVINSRIEEVGRTIDPSKRERQLMQVSQAIVLFLDITIRAEGGGHNVRKALKEVAFGRLSEEVPNLVRIDKLARYADAMKYLNSGGRQSPLAEGLQSFRSSGGLYS